MRFEAYSELSFNDQMISAGGLAEKLTVKFTSSRGRTTTSSNLHPLTILGAGTRNNHTKNIYLRDVHDDRVSIV